MRGGARVPRARRTPGTLSPRPREPTKQMGPYRRPGAADLPGLARHQELRDIARAALRYGLLLLLDHDLFVRGLALEVQERAQGDGIFGRPELGEQHGGGTVGRVVDPARALRHVLDLDHLGLEAFQHEAAPVVGRPERDGFAVLQPALVEGLRVLVVDHVPREVVVDVAVLEDLDERRALVGGGELERLLHVRDVAVHDAGDERGTRRQSEDARADGTVGRAHGRGLGHLAQLARRRVLALGQAVDLVVEEQDRQVHVAPEDVQQVVAADREPVAVAGHDENLELGPRQLEPGGDSRRPPVDRVEAVRVHVVREAARAADPRDEHDVLFLKTEGRHRLLHRAQDGVVPTAPAPPHVLVGLEVLLGVLRHGSRGPRDNAHCFASRSWLMASRISWLASGMPRTRLNPTASTRYSARRTRTSWPLLISGTSTRLNWRRIWPRSGGSGFRWRMWTEATALPSICASSTAAVMAPYVPPQPTTSTSPDSLPLTTVGGISCATRRTFSARVRTMWSWLSAS